MRAGVFDRLRLAIGAVIDGPAMLEQSDATIYVDPGLQARVDDYGNLIIAPVEQASK
jgi:N-methylhydantoinase A